MSNTVRNTIVAFVVLVAASSSAPAFAETPSWRHQVTGVVGGQLFDLGDQFDDFGANFQKEMNIGVRYQYNITPRWAVEGSFLYTPVNAELVRLSRDVSVDTSYYAGNVVLNLLPGRKIAPFVTGGAGGVTLDIQSGGDSETYFAGNFGGGVMTTIADRWSFRVDVRDYVYTVDSLNPQSRVTLDIPSNFDETVHDLSVDFGVTFGF
jgi:outer membrane beta-barrel protein